MTCLSTQYYDDASYTPEIWTWFGIGTLVTLSRLLIRLRQVGLRHFQGDDLLAIAVWICFVAKSVALTLVFLYGSNIDYDVTAVLQLSACQVERVVTGSQMELLAWFAYISIIWGLKGMVLFIFHRLRLSVDRLWLFRAVVIATTATWAAMFLTVCLGCLPFAWNWQVNPPPPPQCSMRMHDVWVSTVLNVFTDLLILSIPLPTLWTSNFTTGRKIGLTLLLCSGLFVMSAAVIRFGFTIAGSTSVNLNKWCQRETTVGIITVNMPVLWTWVKPLLPRKSRLPPIRRSRPKLRTIVVEEQPEVRFGILPSCPTDATRIDSKVQQSMTATTIETTSNFSDTERTDLEVQTSTTAAIMMDEDRESSDGSSQQRAARLPA